MNKCVGVLGGVVLCFDGGHFGGVVVTVHEAIHSFPLESTVLFLWVDDLHSGSTNHAKVGYARTCAHAAE